MDNVKSDMYFDFSSKIVVVTGACGQLGKEICSAFLNANAIVYGLDSSIRLGDTLDGVIYFQVDITQQVEVDFTFDKIRSQNDRIDILVNNAGVSTFEHFLDRTEEAFDHVMDVNLKGTFFCVRSFSRQDTKLVDSPSIVNIASVYGVISPDFRIYSEGDRRNSEIYGASKAGVIQMTKYFSVHLADKGIRVNSVSPGGIFNPANPQSSDFIQKYSDRNPMGRMAIVEEIVPAIMFLSSGRSSYITGQNLCIDGGFTSW